MTKSDNDILPAAVLERVNRNTVAELAENINRQESRAILIQRYLECESVLNMIRCGATVEQIAERCRVTSEAIQKVLKVDG